MCEGPKVGKNFVCPKNDKSDTGIPTKKKSTIRQGGKWGLKGRPKSAYLGHALLLVLREARCY